MVKKYQVKKCEVVVGFACEQSLYLFGPFMVGRRKRGSREFMSWTEFAKPPARVTE